MPSPRPLLARIELVLVIVLVLGYLIAGWRGRDPTGIGGGDELQYRSLSHSLEQGSYRELSRASTPYHVQYPPGYPAWLVLVRHTLGENLDLLRVSNLALVAASLILLFAVARRLGGPGLGLGLMVPLALNEMLLQIGGSLMSEPFYLFLSTSALVATFAADGGHRRWAFAAIALASLAFLTRSAGITLLVAIGMWLWFRRRRAEWLAYALIGGLAVGGWFGFAALTPHDTIRGYARDLSRVYTGPRGLVGFAARVWDTSLEYATKGLPTALSLPTIPGTAVDNLLWLGVTTVLLGIGLIVLWSRWRAVAVYLVIYAGMLVVWPWALGRLLAPIIPLIVLAILLGADRLAARLPGRLRGLTLGVLVALLTIGAAHGAVERDHRSRLCNRADPYRSAGCYNEQTRGLAAMALYLRDHSMPTDIALTAKPPSVYFLSGRRTEHSNLLVGAPAGSAASILRLRGIRFVILVRMEVVETRDVAPVLLASCREFKVEASSLPYALLLSTTPPRGETENACAALQDFIRATRDDPALLAP